MIFRVLAPAVALAYAMRGHEHQLSAFQLPIQVQVLPKGRYRWKGQLQPTILLIVPLVNRTRHRCIPVRFQTRIRRTTRYARTT